MQDDFISLNGSRDINNQTWLHIYNFKGDNGTNVTNAAVNATHFVTICHYPPGNPVNSHTLAIGAAALNVHLAHGDTVGACALDNETNSTDDTNNTNLANDTQTNESDAILLFAELDGFSENPQTNSSATGTAQAALDGDELSISGTFDDLSSPLEIVSGSAGHIHEGDDLENGPVIFPLDVSGNTFSIDVTLDEDQIDALLDELYYINIHSEQFPSGEIRGQLLLNAS